MHRQSLIRRHPQAPAGCADTEGNRMHRQALIRCHPPAPAITDTEAPAYTTTTDTAAPACTGGAEDEGGWATIVMEVSPSGDEVVTREKIGWGDASLR